MINLYLSRSNSVIHNSIPQMISSRGHYVARDNFISTIIKFDERNDLLFFGTDPDSGRGEM